MMPVNPLNPVPRIHETEIRVRYQETDAQGRVHHANYINYFEIGRVEMFRTCGVSYREFEESGVMLVVTDVECKFLSPAKYDDLLLLKTKIARAKGVRIRHEYEIYLGQRLIVQGATTVACVNHHGKVVPLPDWLRLDARPPKTA
jgi:acyl-CoA thioester hydrolase